MRIACATKRERTVTARIDRARERQQRHVRTARTRARAGGVDEVDGRRLRVDERHLNPDDTLLINSR